jgi:hypothetical protein
MGKQPKLEAQLFTGKNCAQSEPDIISAVAPRKTKRGIAANGLTQSIALRSPIPSLRRREPFKIFLQLNLHEE